MNQGDLIPLVLLLLLFFLLGAGSFVIFFVMRLSRQQRQMFESGIELRRFYEHSFRRANRHSRPLRWLAIRSRNVHAVQAALGLRNPKPWSWSEGISGERAIFVAPPVNGWILVVGNGVPDPSDDVDACFRLLLELSRKLGHAQLFHADPVLHYHAWARAEAGRILRGYAWAGTTLWNQGAKTEAETRLGIKCFAYGEACQAVRFGMTDVLAANEEKVSLLAAYWSLDPAEIRERTSGSSLGVAGKPGVKF
jgi:hypothetical protein